MCIKLDALQSVIISLLSLFSLLVVDQNNIEIQTAVPCAALLNIFPLYSRSQVVQHRATSSFRFFIRREKAKILAYNKRTAALSEMDRIRATLVCICQMHCKYYMKRLAYRILFTSIFRWYCTLGPCKSGQGQPKYLRNLSIIPSWLTRGSCGVLLGPVFRTISGFCGIFHFDLVRSGWA